MKYVITDQGEVATGGPYHMDIAAPLKGRVIAAGHCEFENGKVEVWGESIGYGIKSKPEDATLLAKHFAK